MKRIGLKVAMGGIARTWDEAIALIPTGFPAIIRPSFTLGGTGGGVAYNREEYEDIVRRGLDLSPTSQVLIERSLLGWKEYELEVMRDHADNVVIVCSIENIDPMGVHTGDSITVAPAMTLTDREYQTMRDAAVAIIREIGVEAGGCNIQFAVNPDDGRDPRHRDEPARVALIGARVQGDGLSDRAHRREARRRLLARRDHERHHEDNAGVLRAVLDYVVVKCPRFAFEKFAAADPRLTTQMKSVGESMAIGRTFKEAFQKGLRALEIGRSGWHVGARLDRRSPRGRYPRDASRPLRRRRPSESSR
jgi:carbamoyl-phosphate synthase large subunit